jgi:hypothetical protein
MKNTTQIISETQAIQIAKSILKDGFTISYLNANQIEDFIWGYLYEHGLQYLNPIFYLDEFNNQSAAIVHQEN